VQHYNGVQDQLMGPAMQQDTAPLADYPTTKRFKKITINTTIQWAH
jgi:hypothetical protein